MDLETIFKRAEGAKGSGFVAVRWAGPMSLVGVSWFVHSSLVCVRSVAKSSKLEPMVAGVKGEVWLTRKDPVSRRKDCM